MVFLHVDVGDDVVILEGVLTWSEVPGLCFRIIFSLFKAFKFIIKVNNVVGLLVSQRVVSVLCKHINHVLLLSLLNSLFGVFVIIHLGNRVVQEVLFLNKLGCDFAVGLSDPLEISLLINVTINVTFPFVIALGEVILF